jgi:branched-chain amino acid transport system substrate-binding protein
MPRRLSVKGCAIGALLVAALCSAGRAAAAEPTGPPVEINAIITITGNGAFFGQSEAKALGVLEQTINDRGGIQGRPLHFNVLDDQGNPQVTVQLVSQLGAKNVPLFIGPQIPAGCFAAQPIVDRGGPVALCLNPSAHPAAGSYLFDPYPESRDVAATFLRFFRLRGLKRIAILNATDGSGRDADQAFDFAFRLPENRDMQLVANEHYNPTDVSATAQLARIKAVRPQAMVSFNQGLPLGTVLRGMNDLGLDVPVATTGGNMNYDQMQQYADFLPSEILFGGLISWAPGDIGPGPIRDAQMGYVAAIRKAGYRPEAGSATIWDSALLAIDVVRTLGPRATSAQAREYLSNVHGWVGTDGVYDFKGYPQRGIGANAVLIMAWDKTKHTFVPASRRGGALR